jgi:hypothetical protein
LGTAEKAELLIRAGTIRHSAMFGNAASSVREIVTTPAAKNAQEWRFSEMCARLPAKAICAMRYYCAVFRLRFFHTTCTNNARVGAGAIRHSWRLLVAS